MATPPQLTQISFAGGIDESIEAEILDPNASFRVRSNTRQDHRGGAAKRLGFGAMTRARLDATTRTAGRRLIAHDDTVITIDGTNLDVYSSAHGTFRSAGRVVEASVTTTPIASTTVSGQLLDLAVCGNYVVTASLLDRSSGGGQQVILSVATLDGEVVRAPGASFFTTGSDFANCVLATYGVYVFAIFVSTGSGNISAYTLNTTNAASLTLGWSSALGNVATNHYTAGPAPAYLLTSQSLSDRVAFAYVNDSGGTSLITVKTFNASGVLETATINTSSTLPTGICVEGSIADTLWIAWSEGNSVKVQGRDADVLATTLATTATLITTTSAASEIFVQSSTTGAGKLSVNDGTPGLWRARDFITSGGAVTASGSATAVYGVSQRTRPFALNSRQYAGFTGAFDAVSVVCDYTDLDVANGTRLRPVSSVFPGIVSLSSAAQLHTQAISSTEAVYVVPVLRSSVATAIYLVRLDFADERRWQWTAHNTSLVMSGGILSYFDGRVVCEVGFLHRPKKPTATDTGAGSGPTGSNYRYVCTFETVDADGNWCVSGVSDPSDALSVTNHTVTVTTHPLAISNRPLSTSDNGRIAFYRTLTGGEAPYYYVGSVLNDTSVVVSYSDSSTDATISANRLLYGTGNLPGTNGSGQDHRTPPYCADVASYNGMLVVATGSDLWWSGQTVSGEGTWFNPAFYVPIESAGDLTALAVQDGTLYAFKEREVWSVAGETPADNGTAGGLGTPRRLACDVGCISPLSVVVTSEGVFFQSARGIEILSRGGAVSWIGEPIQRTMATYPYVTSASLDARNALVRFSLASSIVDGVVSGEGRDVVYDLTLSQWESVDDKTGQSAHETSQDACVVYSGGEFKYAWLGSDGYVYIERSVGDGDEHLDGTTWITKTAETGSFKLSGIQGQQVVNHVMLMERKTGPHDTSIALAYDYDETTETPTTWTRATIDALLTAGMPITQLKHSAHDGNKGQSVRVRITDATPTDPDPEELVGTGSGATWLGLSLDITPKPGLFDVPETAT